LPRRQPHEAPTPQFLPALSAPAYTALPPGTTEGRRRALLECGPLSLSRMSRQPAAPAAHTGSLFIMNTLEHLALTFAPRRAAQRP
jgi:hypothetical protein